MNIVNLEDIDQLLPRLLQNERAQASLRDALGNDFSIKALQQLASGTFDTQTSDALYDHFYNEIFNKSQDVRTADIFNSLEPHNKDICFGLSVREYEGVYLVWAIEWDKTEYFGSLEEVEDFLYIHWDHARKAP